MAKILAIKDKSLHEIIFVLFFILLMLSGCQVGSTPLSEEEIATLNTEFFNGGTDNINNMFLSSEYSKPEEIDLFQLFYNGIGQNEVHISTNELNMLTNLNKEAPYLDIVKVTEDEMDTFLLKNLGIGMEDTQKTGLENFYYLKEYSSYYLIVGDTNFQWCTIISGTQGPNNQLVLEYIKDQEEDRWVVTLQKKDDGYLFVSNMKTDY